ncbi:hypothetical protein LBYZC6_43110 [Lacrimispora brassicae]
MYTAIPAETLPWNDKDLSFFVTDFMAKIYSLYTKSKYLIRYFLYIELTIRI